jgi:hypothetical protein
MSLLKRRLLYQKVKSKGQIMTKKREVSPNLAQNHPRRGIFRQHSVLSDKLLVPFQHGFDKLSSCGKLEANLPLQEESNAQKNLHR